MQFLEMFHYEIHPVRGSENVADMLSRNPAWSEAAWLCALTRAGAQGSHDTPMRAAEGEEAEDEEDGVDTEVDTQTAHPMQRLHAWQTDPMVLSDTEYEAVSDLMGAILSGYIDDPMFADPSFTSGLKQDEYGMWKRGNQIVVPTDQSLRRRLLAESHDTPSAGHRGIHKTVELVLRTFWWPSVHSDVKQYVRSCQVCQRVKASSKRKGGLLQPLPVPERRWESVSMDLVVKLPRTRSGHDSILVFVDRLTKYALFVPVRESLKAKGFAEQFVTHVVSAFGLPNNVVSDRGGHFVNDFWHCVCSRLRMQRRLSSAYHPETDGQTERMNRVLEEVLRCFVNKRHSDWDKWLPMAQFAINNSRHSATGFTPFYLNHGEHPRAPQVSHLPDMRVIRTTDEWVRHMVQVVNEAKRNLRAAQDRMAAYANQHRRDVTYQPHDKVLLSTVNMTPTEGVRKLMPKYVGPFEVIEMVGKAAVRLSLTDGYERLHDVFHVSLVKPWDARAEILAVPVAPLMYIKDCPELPLIAIVGHRYKSMSHGCQRRVTHWRARWQGKNAVFETWEGAKAIPPDNPHIVQYRADHLGTGYVL
jgi:hypothetical protein